MVSFLIFCFILILIFLLIMIIILINRYLQFPETQPLLSFLPRCHFLGKKFLIPQILRHLLGFFTILYKLKPYSTNTLFYIFHHFTSCIKLRFIRYLVVNKKMVPVIAFSNLDGIFEILLVNHFSSC